MRKTAAFNHLQSKSALGKAPVFGGFRHRIGKLYRAALPVREQLKPIPVGVGGRRGVCRP